MKLKSTLLMLDITREEFELGDTEEILLQGDDSLSI